MQNFVKATWKVSLMIALLSQAGCKAESNYLTTTNASIGGGSGSSSSTSTGFKVTLKAKQGLDTPFIHKFGSVSTACEITPAQIASGKNSIRCMLNMMEYDMWFFGYEYEVSVPKDTCEYLVESPHRYYQYEAGYGPSTAVINATDGTVTSCTVNGVAATASGSTCSTSEVVFKADGSLQSCAYDYTGLDVVGTPPNCCAGSATVTVNATTTDGSGLTTVNSVSTELKYGGSIINCVESANDYITDWPKESVASKALNRINALSSSAYTDSVKIPSPMTAYLDSSRVLTSSTFLNAGFASWSNYASNPDTYGTTRTIPRAMAPLYDLGSAGAHTPAGTAVTAMTTVGDGSMGFDCLGAAGEIKQRIQVYANAWNTIEQFTSFKEGASAASVTPNTTGTVGVDCASINGLSNSCNTIWGFDDMITNATLGSTYGGSGVAGAYVFPRELDRPSPP